MLSEQQFIAAGFTPKYYSDLKYIVHDEEQHVLFLEGALKAAGAMPVAACTYKFPFTNVMEFITLSSVLEGVGTAAYLGGAPLVTSKAYLSAAGSILITEALHTSMQRAALGEVPEANPFGTPLNPNPVFTLAAMFIVSCPPTNPTLPFMAFPSLTAVQGLPAAPGMPFEFSVAGALPSSFFVTFVSGLMTTSVMPTVMGATFTAVIPDTVSGQSYAFVTNAKTNTTLMDSMILFGPAILEVTPMAPTFDLTVQ